MYIQYLVVNHSPRPAIILLFTTSKSGPIPHCYEVKDYEPHFNHLDIFQVPAQITFKGHTTYTTGGPPATGNSGGASRTSTPRPRPPQTRAPDPYMYQREAVSVSMDIDSASPSPSPSPSPSDPADSDLEPDPLPSPELIRIHAALAGVLHQSGAYKTFDRLFQPLVRRKRSADLAAFWRSVVEYGGRRGVWRSSGGFGGRKGRGGAAEARSVA
ncbi:hypothetical protein GSI_12346 [Ganoderma sinense ZZ0214-1]|uniref:Uncharacterized protein n=1 Tax=Ganoderma sinense ZZ0214-1 TaxID=1077348 RepID=A0A2G8RZ44_9APHY|nr:hypothetical protein GSI_12346 [Ganoderma sinense ZZ0214-1]